MILEDSVCVRVAHSNKDYYYGRGYDCSAKYISVKTLDLLPSSAALVTSKCETCGSEAVIRFSSWYKRKLKANCKLCVGHATKSIDFIRQEFEERGYTLLSERYHNAHQKLEYICHKHPGKTQSIIYNSLQRGSGCRKCGLIRRGQGRALTYQEVLDTVGSLPYKFIRCDLEAGAKSRVYLYCEKHSSSFDVIYNNIQQGGGCYLCGRDKCRGQNNFMYKGETIYPSQYIRSYLTAWKNTVSSNAKYLCELTGMSKDTTDFDIHHTKSSTTIMHEVLAELGEYIPEKLDKELIDKALPRYLIAHDTVQGVFLGHAVHKLYHSLYGRDGSCPEDFEEFRSDFIKGWLVFPHEYPSRKHKRSKKEQST